MVEKLVDDEGKKIEECSYSWEKAMRELEVVIVKDWMMEQGNEREVISKKFEKEGVSQMMIDIKTEGTLHVNVRCNQSMIKLHSIHVKPPPKPPRDVDTVLINEQQKKQIEEWIEKKGVKWTLLFRASRDGFSSQSFHKHCDKKGATVTIVRSTGGYLFGGFTPTCWESSTPEEEKNRRGHCKKARKNDFLFTLTNPHGISSMKFNHRTGEKISYGIYCHISWGPIFGGNDLFIYSDCNVKNSWSNLNYSYFDPTGKGNILFTGSHNFQVSDYEVFMIGGI